MLSAQAPGPRGGKDGGGLLPMAEPWYRQDRQTAIASGVFTGARTVPRNTGKRENEVRFAAVRHDALASARFRSLLGDLAGGGTRFMVIS